MRKSDKDISESKVGYLEMAQCVCPLCLINCLSGHHFRSYWSEKDKHTPSDLASRLLPPLMMLTSTHSFIIIFSPCDLRRAIFKHNLCPFSILPITSRSTGRVRCSWNSLVGLRFPPLPVMRLHVSVSYYVSQLTQLRLRICQAARVNQGVCHVG